MRSGTANQDSIGEKAVASWGNVFAGLGLSLAGLGAARQSARAVAINGMLDLPGLPQGAAAGRLRISQPRVSALKNCRLQGLSVEKLMHFLNAIDQHSGQTSLLAESGQNRCPGGVTQDLVRS